MNESPDRAAEDALGTYWDWITAGGGGDRPPIDPASGETIARLARLDGERVPSVTFVRALQETLMNDGAAAPVDARPTPGTVRRRPPGSTAPFARWRASAGFTRVLSAAGAAVVAVALVLVTLSTLWGGWRNDDEGPGGVGFQVATPTAVERDVLLTRAGIEPPEEYNWVAVERYTIAPGATLATGARENTGYGAWLALVESGAVRFTADGEAMRQATETAAETAVAAGTAIELHAGERVFTPTGVGATWANAGADEVRLIAISVVRTNSDMSEPGQEGVASDSPMYRTTALEPGPLDVRLERITLQPGATLAGAPTVGMRMIAVETGTIEVTWAKPDAPGIATGKPFIVESFGSVDVNTDRFYALEIANRTAAPVTILSFSVDVEPSPLGTPDAG